MSCCRIPTTTAFLARPSIVLFGDSITEYGFAEGSSPGWVSSLASSYSRRADVLNRGYSGYTTRQAIEIFESVSRDTKRLYADGGKILFWTVFFGANDASLPGSQQHVPIEEYGQNIRTIVRSIREQETKKSVDDNEDSNEMPIILISPPPVDENIWVQYCAEVAGTKKSDRLNKASKQYGSKLKEVGADLGCPILDTYQLLDGDGESYPKYLSDGLHLNGEGNALLYKGLMDLIESKYPKIAPMVEGEGRYGSIGIPLEEELWTEIC